MYFKAQIIALFITDFILKTIFGTLQNNPGHNRIKKDIKKKKSNGWKIKWNTSKGQGYSKHIHISVISACIHPMNKNKE